MAMVCFLSSRNIKWRGGDPHLPYTDSPLLSLKAQYLVLLCSPAILDLSVTSSHGFSYCADDTQLILLEISSCRANHQMKLNLSKTELLFIPGDSSLHQALVSFLDKILVSLTTLYLGTASSPCSFILPMYHAHVYFSFNIRRTHPFVSTQVT